MIKDLKNSITNFGKSVLTISGIFASIPCLKNLSREYLKQLEIQGIQSLFVVFFSATSIGMVVAVQFGKEIIGNFGAGNLVGGFVAMAFFRELAPVFIAVVLAGKVGAAITAELGAMKVTEQIDAMEVFNMNPKHFLLTPRLLALLSAGPLLTIYGTVIAILSGQFFTKLILDLPPGTFFESVKSSIHDIDFIAMILKSIIFSLIIGIIASLNGLNTRGGSEAVGEQTTKTVVWCFLSIFVVNYLITSMLF